MKIEIYTILTSYLKDRSKLSECYLKGYFGGYIKVI
jgi:hypothetical protein